MKVVIIGGVAGGASAAARLRRLDEQAEIVMFERGPYVSFANCGLPYYIGGVIQDREELLLQTPESFRSRFNIDVRINCEVLEIDPLGKTVRVKAAGNVYEEHWDKLLLAPGAEPIRPNIPGVDGDRVLTLRSIPDMDRIAALCEKKQVHSAVVCGGGYIGIETAENLLRRGIAVTLVERNRLVMGTMDEDVTCELQAYMIQRGIRILAGTSVKGFTQAGDQITVETDGEAVTADLAVLALGVVPDSRLASQAGLQLGVRGAIVVDRHMHTSKADIYAAGDAVESDDLITGARVNIALAGPANKQGRIAADNICGISSTYTGVQGTAILGFDGMTIAATGLTEMGAKRAGIIYDKTYTYSASHAGYYPDAHSMAVKILWEKESRRLLGAQIVGFDGVDKRMDVIATAIRLGASVDRLTELELCYAPPFGSAKDPVNFAGFVTENVNTGKLKQYFWHDVAALPRDGSVTLLDVRTPEEYTAGHIEGFANCQLDGLRNHLDEIPKDRPVYIHCHSGLRSYLACRLLTGHGYDCYNLAGGWRLYRAATAFQK